MTQHRICQKICIIELRSQSSLKAETQDLCARYQETATSRAEGGDALNAFAAAAARAFAKGDGTATAWAKAMAAAIAQYSCDAVKPAIAGEHILCPCSSAPALACQESANVVGEPTGLAVFWFE